MNKKKIFLRLLAVAGFLGGVFSVFFACQRFNLGYTNCKGLIISVLILFNAIIIISELAFGEVGLWVSVALSSLLTFFVSLGLNIPFLNSQIPIFIALGFFVSSFKNRIVSYGLSIDRQIDNLEEERNALTAERASTQRANEALKEKLIRYAKLKDLTARLCATLSLDSIIKIVIDNVSELMDKLDAVLLYLVDEETQELALRIARSKTGPISIKSKRGDIFDIWVLKQRQPLLVADVGKDFRFNLDMVPEEFKREYESLIAAPLISEKKVIGVLRVESKEADDYAGDDLRLLAVLADLAAMAIGNAKLYHRIEELAIRDDLTGLYCHRYFKDRLNEDFIKATRISKALSILMLDIDNFKDYNDRYGHTAGDIVLKEIAEILESSVEPGDLVARYGGEEFVLILLGKGKAEAQKFAETLRRKIESKVFLLRKLKTHVTVSMGCATFPKDSISEDELVRLADAALYEAKKLGRNKVCLA